jgi:two-component system CheB/CheR fusion protein
MNKNDAAISDGAGELRFRMLVENSTDIIIHANIQREITYISPAVKRIMGYEVEEVIGMRLRDMVYEADLTRLLNEFEEVLDSPGTSFKKEYRVKRKEGGFVWVEGTITNLLHMKGVEGIIINQRDITDKKEKEEELFKSNERLLYVARATNDAIWDWNLETDVVTRTGHGLKTNFGYDPDEASKDKDFWVKKVHPDDLSAVLEKRTRALDNPNDFYWDDEYRIIKSDGNFAYIYDKGYIIRNEEGKALRMIGATQDITRRRAAEGLLAELNTRLKKRATELAASNIELERFAYVASHDLQEPLRMVSSFLQLFRKKYQGHIDETADQYIHYALDGAERMKKLILDLLTYSRVGSDKSGFEQVNMKNLLTEVLNLFEKEIRESAARIEVKDMPLVNANKTQMFQLFQNLLGNALKYRDKEMPRIVVSSKELPDHYIFSIEDNGIGIDKAYHEKIFQIFQRLHSKGSYSGTGIGLAICKKIVERHGGSIWVEGEKEKGSRFYFTLAK